MKMYGPFTQLIEIHFTDGEENFAKLTYHFPSGEVISTKEIGERIIKEEQRIKDQLGNDWHLCKRQEFCKVLLQEKTGITEKMYFPGGDEWDIIKEGG